MCVTSCYKDTHSAQEEAQASTPASKEEAQAAALAELELTEAGGTGFPWKLLFSECLLMCHDVPSDWDRTTIPVFTEPNIENHIESYSLAMSRRDTSAPVVAWVYTMV